ncbi:endonuclease/exonuclease/phosphatase family protein [Gorillibacterium sp. sgz500922]|uniref:endonuclease/exonuclease/phosphatase family protein n=1 Tax=Gorillibacterium sp. sgz500922 TaxID=3446694 RepID=UPI003F6741FD
MTAIKAMTFNLRVMVESDGKNAWTNRIVAAGQAVLDKRPDVLSTQEGRYGMLEELHAQLSGYAWLGEGRRGGREDEHCAVFYDTARWQPVESGNFGLSEQPETLGVLSWNTDYPRMCTWVRLRSLTGEGELAVFNTHLDHISEEAQVKGMALIRERMEELKRSHPGLPLVLTGDFNVEPDHAVIRGLEEAGYVNVYSALPVGAPDRTPGMTFHDFQGGEAGQPIDYLFFSPDVRVESVSVDRGQYDGRYPSDHYPVCAWIEL